MLTLTVLACGVGPSYWRVGLALARLGENRRHWLEWPSGGKKPVLPRGEGRWVWGVASLARHAKPEPTNVIPLIPEVRVRVWSSVKSAVSSWRHRSLTGVGGGASTYLGGALVLTY